MATQRKVFGHIFEEPTGNQATFLKEFRQASKILKEIVAKNSEKLGALPTERLLEILAKAEKTERLDGPTDRNGFVLSASSTPLHFKSDEIKDGRNGKNGNTFFMSLNEPLWVRSDRIQRVELLFHECLGLTGVDDSRYQYSSRIWKLAPARPLAFL
jgi:hypothetical protein